MSDNYDDIIANLDPQVVQTIGGEALNQGSTGWRAVASVIANRARQAGQTLGDVVRAPGQFEGRAPGVRNISPDSDTYRQIAQATAPILAGLQAPTVDADSFYAPKAQRALGRAPPRFENGTGVDIGDHRFFKTGYTGAPSVVGDDYDPSLFAAPKTAAPPQNTVSDDYDPTLFQAPPKAGDGDGYDPTLFQAPAPQAGSPGAQASPQMGDARVVESGGLPVSLAVQNAALAAYKAHRVDPYNAPVGSAQNPYYPRSASELSNVKPGDFYWKDDGTIVQAPGGVKSDEGLGVEAGASKVAGNLELGLDNLAHKVPLLGDGVDAASRFITGLGNFDPASGKWVAGHSVTIPQAVQQQQDYLADRRQQGVVPGKIGTAVGEIGALAPLGFALPEIGGSALAGAVAQGGIGGALTTDKRDLAGIGGDALFGGATGGILHGAAGAVGSAIAPKLAEAQQFLRDHNVLLTPGQAIGGLAKTLEDKVAGVLPFAGDVMRGAQTNSIRSMNRAVANDALSSLGKTVPDNAETNRQLVKYVGDTIGDHFDAALQGTSSRVDPQLMSDYSTIAAKLNPKTGARQRFIDEVQHNFTNRMDLANQNGVSRGFSGDAWKDADSQIGAQAASLKGSPDVDMRSVGGALQQFQAASRDWLARQNPAKAADLTSANEAWAKFVRMRDAGQTAGGEYGSYSPAQLAMAVRNGDKSLGNGRYAAGDALMQQFADHAVSVLPNRTPDSGTAGRVAVEDILKNLGRGITGVSEVGAGAADHAATLPILGLNAALAAAYSPPAIRAFNAYLTPGATRAAIGSAARGFMGRTAGVVGGVATNDDFLRQQSPWGLTFAPAKKP